MRNWLLVSIMNADVLVLKHQDISIHNTDALLYHNSFMSNAYTWCKIQFEKKMTQRFKS